MDNKEGFRYTGIRTSVLGILQKYILNDYNGIPADGGEDSGNDDAQEDDGPFLDELLND